MKSRRDMLGLILMLVGTILFISNASLAAPPKGTLKEAIHWNVAADYLDPALGRAMVTANMPLYFFHDALIKPMPGNLYAPCLAESWKVKSSSTIYEFNLRKGVKFHNGDTMTAEDVVFSFWRYKGAYAKYIHDKTAKVEILNPYAVRFQFKEPFADFLDYLAPGASTIGWIVPKKYVEKIGDAEFKKKPIGAGPYRFVEFVPGQRLVGEAFEGFWRKIPNIKRIEVHIVSDNATRLAMVKRGEMDIGTRMVGVFYEELKKTPGLRMLAPPSGSQFLIYFASQWDLKSPWADIRVRKAASMAIDRQALVDVFTPGAHPIGTLGLEGDPDAVHLPADPYDPQGAKKLLAEAGYPDGFHGGKFYPYDGGMWAWGEQIVTDWKAVGITVDTVLLQRPAWIAQRDSGKMKGAVFMDALTAPTIGMRLQYLLGPTAYGAYPDIQGLWEKYLKESSAEARKDLVTRVQKSIYDKVMWLPLTSNNVPTALGPKVKGNPFKIPPMMWYATPFEDIELND